METHFMEEVPWLSRSAISNRLTCTDGNLRMDGRTDV